MPCDGNDAIRWTMLYDGRWGEKNGKGKVVFFASGTPRRTSGVWRRLTVDFDWRNDVVAASSLPGFQSQSPRSRSDLQIHT